MDPRPGRVGNHREVSPAFAAIFILKVNAVLKHLFGGRRQSAWNYETVCTNSEAQGPRIIIRAGNSSRATF